MHRYWSLKRLSNKIDTDPRKSGRISLSLICVEQNFTVFRALFNFIVKSLFSMWVCQTMATVCCITSLKMGGQSHANSTLLAAHHTSQAKYTVHCKKRLAVFPSPAGMSLTKLSLAGNNLIYSRPGRAWFVTSWLGTGKSVTFFLQCNKTLRGTVFRHPERMAPKSTVRGRKNISLVRPG